MVVRVVIQYAASNPVYCKYDFQYLVGLTLRRTYSCEESVSRISATTIGRACPCSSGSNKLILLRREAHRALWGPARLFVYFEFAPGYCLDLLDMEDVRQPHIRFGLFQEGGGSSAIGLARCRSLGSGPINLA